MVNTRSARSNTPSAQVPKVDSDSSRNKNQAVLVKKDNKTIVCYLPEPFNPKSRSILVQKLDKSGSETKYEAKEELKINPKDIIKHIEISKSGKIFTLSKQDANLLSPKKVAKPSPAKKAAAKPESPNSPDIESSSSEADVEESSAEVPGVGRKRTPSKTKTNVKVSAPKKKLKLEVYKKGVTNPKVNLLKINPELQDPNPAPDYSVSVLSSNRNVHRAVFSNNQGLFKTLLKSNEKISSLFGYWGPEYLVSPLELAISLNNDFFIREIFKEIKNPKLKKTFIPESGLKTVGTGFVSKQAYGVQVRSVGMSRGGREGNNAFLSQETAVENYTSLNWKNIIHKCTPHTINLLCTLIPNFENFLGNYIGAAVRSGNVDISRHLLQIHTKKGSFGFNFLHLEVLQKAKLSQFKKVSITKKPIENFSVAPLHVACINPDPTHLKALMAECDDIGYADLEGRRSVHYAAACTSKKPLEVLISAGANINEMDRKKITPLMIAATYNRVETTKLLLEKGVSTKIKSKESKGPIHYAAENGCLDVLQILAPASDVNQPGGDRKTALMYAAANGYYNCVEFLLDHGARITAKDKCKRTALTWAVKNGHTQIVSLLLVRGAPYDEGDSSKNYPIHYAAAYGWKHCLELLLSAGADVNVVNDWKLPPLLIAMLKAQMGIVERLLQEPSVDVNCKDESGRTLLSQAIEVLSEDTLKQIKYFIEEKKADPNIADQNGWTPLHHLADKEKPVSHNSNWNWTQKKEWAAKAWELQEKAAQLLINGGADLNKKTDDGFSPLMHACNKKNAKVARILIESGAELGDVGGNLSILHLIGSFDSEFLAEAGKIVEKVPDHSELLNIVNENGFSPLIEFVKYLENARDWRSNLFNRIKRDEIERINLLRKAKKMKLLDEMSYNEVFDDDLTLEQVNKEHSEDSEEEIEEEVDEELEIEGEEEEEVEEMEVENEDNNLENDEENNEEADQIEGKEENESNSLEIVEELSSEDQNMDIEGGPHKSKELSLDEIHIKKLTEAQWTIDWGNYFSLLQKLVQKGASLTQPVQKLKKYRENPLLAQTEESPTNSNFIIIPSGEKVYEEYDKQHGLKSVLHYVFGYFSSELVQFLLSEGANINHQDFYGNSPLLAFVANTGSQSLIKLLLDNKADPNIQNYIKQQNILHIATLKGNHELVEMILDYKPELNQKDSLGCTALTLAAEKRYTKVVRLLCQAGADANIPNAKGRNPLHFAFRSATTSSNASFDVESILLLHGANINAVDKFNRCALHYAFLKKSNKSNLESIDPIETVSSACSKKEINVNLQDKYQRTPLHYAARRGALTSTMFLLSKGANVEIVDIDGNTPLALGIIGGHANYVSMLLQRNVDIQKNLFNKKSDKKNALNYNRKLEDGQYSYFRACVRLDWQGAAYLLLFSGYPYGLAMQDALNELKFELVLTLFAKVDDPLVFSKKNSEGQNLFHTLAVKGASASKEIAEQIFQQLMDLQVGYDEADIYGRTPLHYAAENSNYVLCDLLLKKGVDVNHKDNSNNTPLIKAVEGDLIKNSFKIIHLFSQHSADFSVKVQNSTYSTSIYLHSIEKNCSDSTMKLLLKSGCKLTEVDSLGRNALMLLILNNDLARVKSLLKSQKFDLNTQDYQGRSIVHYCISPFPGASYENKILLELLLQSGASGILKDLEGHTPYYLASMQLSGRMKEVLEKHKITEELNPVRKYSGYEKESMEIDFKKEAAEYSASLNLIKQVEDISDNPDPAGGFADYFKVVGDYDILMNKVDVSFGPYSAYNFYRMQLLRDTNRDVYVVFTRWGRIGEIGAFQRTPFANLEEGEKEFKTIFRNKSGNEWGGEFKRIRGKYMLVKFNKTKEINKDHLQDFNFNLSPKSSLPEELFDTIKLFSKDSIYRESMSRLNTDINRLNFSNISEEVILEAEELLNNLHELCTRLSKTKENEKLLQIKEQICDFSNRYYELVPRNGRIDSMIPPLMHLHSISSEVEIIYALKNIEIASKLLLGALKNQLQVNPCDYIYQCLPSSMTVLDQLSPEFRFINQYFLNGSQENYKVKNVFEVRRQGEKERIEKHSKIKHRKLLWHGSPTCNFLGILNQGLKISPAGGATHGRMFGNGIYFADRSSKSMNYSYTFSGLTANDSFLLLCEVVLGKVQNEYKGNEFALRSGYNSFQGLGTSTPDPSKSVYLTNGVEIPLGNYIPVKRSLQTMYYLNDNEYIVYKEDQIRIRYLVHAKNN